MTKRGDDVVYLLLRQVPVNRVPNLRMKGGIRSLLVSEDLRRALLKNRTVSVVHSFQHHGRFRNALRVARKAVGMPLFDQRLVLTFNRTGRRAAAQSKRRVCTV